MVHSSTAVWTLHQVRLPCLEVLLGFCATGLPTYVFFFLLKLLLLLWVAVLAGLFGSLPSVCSEEVDIDDRVTFSIIFVFGLLRAV